MRLWYYVINIDNSISKCMKQPVYYHFKKRVEVVNYEKEIIQYFELKFMNK